MVGATDGIGYAMAMEFARKGLNVVLISRTKSKLETCAEEIRAKYKSCEVKCIDIDFSNFDDVARKRVDDVVKSLDSVGVLVNNVGVSYPFTKYFHELTDQEVAALMTLNIDSTTWMTRIVLPSMLEKKRGAIVNIGSAAGVSISPLLAQYGAAKSYVAMFSRALNAELAGMGIHVQCQVPMFVATKLAKIRKASLFVASPAGYARSAVAAIGYGSVVSPYWSHALQLWFLTSLPEWIVSRIVFNMHSGYSLTRLTQSDIHALYLIQLSLNFYACFVCVFVFVYLYLSLLFRYSQSWYEKGSKRKVYLNLSYIMITYILFLIKSHILIKLIYPQQLLLMNPTHSLRSKKRSVVLQNQCFVVFHPTELIA